jgi:hypothetical protein
MKSVLIAIALCAVVAVAVAEDAASLDETTDLLQTDLAASAKVGTGAKTSIKLGAAAGTKAGTKAKAQAMVMLGEKMFSAEAVMRVKKELQDTVQKIGKTRPAFLAQAKDVEDLANDALGEGSPTSASPLANSFDGAGGNADSEGTGGPDHVPGSNDANGNPVGIVGGYKKLKKVLFKVDELHAEILWAKFKASQGKKEKIKECFNFDDSDNENKEAMHEQWESNFKNEIVASTTGIADAKMKIVENRLAIRNTIDAMSLKDCSLESSDECVIVTAEHELKAQYGEYWTATDDRAAVRNILMQALWLVCTGFAKFRHDPYCESLRAQPDFAEPLNDPVSTGCSVRVNGETPANDCTGNEDTNPFIKNQKNSIAFSETMASVWAQQKTADNAEINSVDGDLDMEKGFVNNKAPWGVDQNKEEEETNLSSSQVAERLTFLLQNSEAPRRVAGPITGLINALQTADGDNAGSEEGESKTLVETLMILDREEGENQAIDDERWDMSVNDVRGTVSQFVNEELQAFAALEGTGGQEETIQTKMNYIDSQLTWMAGKEAEEKQQVQTYRTAIATCDAEILQYDQQIELNFEELVNVMRLNSLLRFLAIGDDPMGSCRMNEPEAEQVVVYTVGGTDNSCTWNQANRRWIYTDDGGTTFECPDYECNGDNGGGSCIWMDRGKESDAKGTGNEGPFGYLQHQLELQRPDDLPSDFEKPWFDNDASTAAIDGLTGVDVPGLGGSDKTMCACEYGFWGEFCEKRTCPGRGTVRYRSGQKGACWDNTGGDAAGRGSVVMNRGTCIQDDSTSKGTCACACHPTDHRDAYGTLGSGSTDVNRPCYHGSKCEFATCPIRVNRVTMKAEYGSNTNGDDPAWCAGHGDCDTTYGHCECKDTATVDGITFQQYWGHACDQVKCPASNSAGGAIESYYASTNGNSCSGKGTCQDVYEPGTNTAKPWFSEGVGKCACEGEFEGDACEMIACEGGADCNGKGTCDEKTGMCACAVTASGGNCDESGACRSCDFYRCGAHGTAFCNQGKCDIFTGECACDTVTQGGQQAQGDSCEEPGRYVEGGGAAREVDWSRSFDKWGWSVCPSNYGQGSHNPANQHPGELMIGFATDGKGDALYNIERGYCARPMYGAKDSDGNPVNAGVKIQHCYHENWWKKFDTAGGKFCRRNFFIAGLFRSHCNSLYCLEMAKCCQIRRAIWSVCSWQALATQDLATSSKIAMVSGRNGDFIAGFYRSHTHTLAGLTHFRTCNPLWYGNYGQQHDD